MDSAPQGGNSWFDQNAPPTSTAPTAGTAALMPPTASGPPSGGSFSDPAYAAQFVSYYANQPGANPSLRNDPNYWIQKITSGELGADPNYIIGKFMTPEGAPAGSNTLGALGGGQYAQGGPFPGFTPPSYQDFLNSPGLQFGLDQGMKAITQNGSAKGTALGGPQLKALSDYATNYGLTQYGNVFNQALATNQQNFGINQGNFGNLYALGNWGIGAVNGATA